MKPATVPADPVAPVVLNIDGLHLDAAAVAAAVRSEQLHLLAGRQVDLLLNILIALLVASTIGHMYGTGVWAGWLAMFVVVVLARYWLRLRFAKAAGESATSWRWGMAFTAVAFATGLLWGLTGSVVLVTSNTSFIVFVVFVLGGVMAGGIVGNAVFLPAMVAFLLPTTLPAVVVLLISPIALHKVMGLVLAIFTVVITNGGRNINLAIAESLRLRFGQQAMMTRVRASEAAMAAAQEIARIGNWEFDVPTGRSTWSAEVFRILGLDPVLAVASYPAGLARVHPDDRSAVVARHVEWLHAHEDLGMDHRIVMADGTVRWVHEVAHAQIDAHGRTLRLFGTMQDITARKLSESTTARLAAIVDSSFDGIAGETMDGTITSWNGSAERMFGYTAAEIIGRNVRLIVPEDGRDALAGMLVALQRGDALEPFDTERLRKDGTRIPVSIVVSPMRDPAGQLFGASFISRDITANRKATAAILHADRILHAVTVGTRILLKADSLELGMPDAMRVLGESLGVDRVLMIQDGRGTIAVPQLRYSWQAPGIGTRIASSDLAVPLADRAAWAAWYKPLTEGRPVIAQQATSDEPQRTLLERLDSRSLLLVPLVVGDRLWGGLGIDCCRLAHEWTAGEVDALKTFADIVGEMMKRDETRIQLATSLERFRVLNATAQDAVITIDAANQITTWNLAAERILGYAASEAVGRKVADVLSPVPESAAGDPAMDIFAATGADGAQGRTTELAVRRKDGAEISVELSLAGARVGGAWESIGILRDITVRKATDASLAFANLLLRTQMEASPDGILVVDAEHRIIGHNQRFADIWRIPAAAFAAGDDAVVLTRVAAAVKDPEAFLAQVDHLYAHPGDDNRTRIETTDGRALDRYTVTLHAPAGEYLGRAWFFRDITAQEQATAQAIQFAHFDVLTGLANRAAFAAALDQAVVHAKRGQLAFALLYLDLDHFKDVNDTLGHPVGDALLVAVAKRLRSNVRECDTVARFGGDEFAVIVTALDQPASVALLADQLIRVIAAPFSIQGNTIFTGASIGIDVYGPGSPDAEALLSHADVALYGAKREGRGGYRFFTDAMDKEVRLRVALGTELRNAIDAGELFLLYQPQVVVETGQITGVEALVRWRHPQRGTVGPGVFIPIAESIGIISRLGHWVLWAACRQGRAWFDAGLPPFRICVNVSGGQFRSSVAMEADIVAALAETGMPAHLLELELTESVLMDASRDHAELLQRLNRLGVTVAIDDFGTGYSSLDYLRRFPSNRIKIAQTFVKDLETTPGDAAIVKATIGLARELGIMVIAEGAERQTQVDLLRSWGCADIQGYYFAPPLVPDEIGRLMQAGGIIPPKTSQDVKVGPAI